MELEFNGQYDQPTYFKAVSLACRPSRRILLIRILLFLLLGAVFIALIVDYSQKGTVSTLEGSRMVKPLVTLFLLAYFIFQPYIAAYRSASQSWKDPQVRRRFNGRISSLGVQNDLSQGWIHWEEFVKVHKSPSLVVLLIADRTFVALPRSFFKSDQEWTMLNQLVDTRVQEAI